MKTHRRGTLKHPIAVIGAYAAIYDDCREFFSQWRDHHEFAGDWMG